MQFALLFAAKISDQVKCDLIHPTRNRGIATESGNAPECSKYCLICNLLSDITAIRVSAQFLTGQGDHQSASIENCLFQFCRFPAIRKQVELFTHTSS